MAATLDKRRESDSPITLSYSSSPAQEPRPKVEVPPRGPLQVDRDLGSQRDVNHLSSQNGRASADQPISRLEEIKRRIEEAARRKAELDAEARELGLPEMSTDLDIDRGYQETVEWLRNRER